ncbi:hypothetical protein QBC39DRAFT_270995 [Podospora conica]|nr:hypothetical protein QBC39DRAFT_270995 [Schizothecium conicum]
MSLNVDDPSRRGRSRSPGGPPRDRSRTRPDVVDAVPYPTSSGPDLPGSSAAYEEYERLARYSAGPPGGGPPPDDDDDDDAYYRRRRDDYRGGGPPPPSDRDRDRDRGEPDDRDAELQRAAMFLPQKYANAKVTTVAPPGGMGDEGPSSSSPRDSRDSLRNRDRDSDRERKERERQRKKDKLDDDLAYGKDASAPPPGRPSSPPYAYAQPKQWEYARPDEARYASSSARLDPGGPAPGRREPSPGPMRSAMKRGTSPQPPLHGRMASLTVNTGHHTASMGMSLSAAPPSPLLESYHGTYQQLSPMPSPLLLPNRASDAALSSEALSLGYSDDDRNGDKKRSRRARFHDPVDDAARLAKALKGERRAPETEPLTEILPGLTHEQVMELRAEYKRLVKTGSERKGVNIAKHIRSRLKDEDPNLMKACYATALGRWESEAYWANFWYHGDKTRRELLIESLMGRTNDEVRRIKDGFADKKYGDSLTRCMRTELKEDKFKKAVLMVLEEQRMEEADAYGRPLRLDRDLVCDDVKQLNYAVRSEKGGESLMINIVISRSDAHLREVLRVYRETFKGANFAKDALKKSGNLVGEVLAHILNGVINKPVRDAMLLHHALTASKRDELRRELLISRLVRYHWDGAHMVAVKRAYREHYGRDLQDAVRDAVSGELGEFCRALCITRMPDHVRKIDARGEGGRDRDRDRDRERERERERERR